VPFYFTGESEPRAQRNDEMQYRPHEGDEHRVPERKIKRTAHNHETVAHRIPAHRPKEHPAQLYSGIAAKRLGQRIGKGIEDSEAEQDHESHIKIIEGVILYFPVHHIDLPNFLQIRFAVTSSTKFMTAVNRPIAVV
jgi:hypothetical protein